MSEYLHADVQAYLDAVVEQVKFREAHAEIRQELKSHIEELAEAGERQGRTTEEAIAQALKQMGNPIEVGQKLHQVHKPKTDWILIGLAVVALFPCLIFNYYGPRPGLLDGETAQTFLDRLFGLIFLAPTDAIDFLIVGLIGSALAFGLSLWNYRSLQRWGKWIYFLTLLVLVVGIAIKIDTLGVASLFDPVQMSIASSREFMVQEQIFAGKAIDSQTLWNSYLTLSQFDFPLSYVLAGTPLLLVMGLVGIFSQQQWNQRWNPLLWIGLLIPPVIGFSALNMRYAALLLMGTAIALMFHSKAKGWQIVTAIASLLSVFYYFYTPPVYELASNSGLLFATSPGEYLLTSFFDRNVVFSFLSFISGGQIFYFYKFHKVFGVAMLGIALWMLFKSGSKRWQMAIATILLVSAIYIFYSPFFAAAVSFMESSRLGSSQGYTDNCPGECGYVGVGASILAVFSGNSNALTFIDNVILFIPFILAALIPIRMVFYVYRVKDQMGKCLALALAVLLGIGIFLDFSGSLELLPIRPNDSYADSLGFAMEYIYYKAWFFLRSFVIVGLILSIRKRQTLQELSTTENSMSYR